MCARWDSDRVLSGSMNCERKFNNKDKVVEMVCTKAEVKHADMTSKRAGMLMMKRTKCVSTDGDTFKCAVFKVD